MKILLFFLLITIDLLSVFSTNATAYNPYKLPSTIIPYKYQVYLRPDFYDKSPEDFLLTGNVEIDAKVIFETNNVTLHSVDLILGNVSIIRNGQDLYKDRTYNEERQWFVFNLNSVLKAGDFIKIKIDHFQTQIQHKLNGLYYTITPGRNNSSNNVSYGVTTDLEPVHARQVFPCFDEPALNAVFHTIIAHKSSHTALSNMPLKQQFLESNSDWIVSIFDPTPKMSTYLFAAIVTEYESISTIHRNVHFTIYYPRNKRREVNFTMRLTKRAFDKMRDYIGVEYPLPKLDQIGFRRQDYAALGMENFGMITYRGDYFYATPKNEAVVTEAICVIIHELAHQWFGNLVVINWWSDLWLKEAMSLFFSHARGKWFKEFKVEGMVLFMMLQAMAEDMFGKAGPVYVPWVQSPKEISENFNIITYGKGGMVLRMAEAIVGENFFRESLRRYVRRNKYATVTNEDLWSAFAATSKKFGYPQDMKRILTPWLEQPGFPIVNVTFNNRTGWLHFEQALFFKTPSECDAQLPKPSPYKYKWPLPLQWTTRNHGESNVSVTYKKQGVIKEVNKLSNSDWLVVNPKGNFFYIVNYEKWYWKKLGLHLLKNHTAFHLLTRGKIITDIACLYLALKSKKIETGYVDADTVNAVLAFAAVETDKMVLEHFVRTFGRSAEETNLKPIADILKKRKLI